MNVSRGTIYSRGLSDSILGHALWLQYLKEVSCIESRNAVTFSPVQIVRRLSSNRLPIGYGFHSGQHTYTFPSFLISTFVNGILQINLVLSNLQVSFRSYCLIEISPKIGSSITFQPTISSYTKLYIIIH